ncbi:MAG TPA: MFS transporter [Casimicrobiaceae bacterium]|nr:MFS transporter [Casimicrobiaceae bacterium]
MTPFVPDSPYAVRRLLIALALMTIGTSGMHVVVVVLPAVQSDFGVARADASLPYTALLIGWGVGGVLMGRIADRHGVMRALMFGSLAVAAGFALASSARDIYTFAIIHGVLLGFFGCSAFFAPLIADTSLWFDKRRGIAVGLCASGNYLAGAVWPPIVSIAIESVGWRTTYLGMSIVCGVTLLALASLMHRRPPTAVVAQAPTGASSTTQRPFGLSPTTATVLLCIAGMACCVAMSMPQVHVVALCADLGYGTMRGAQMLSVMLGFGIASRLASGYICDRIGGLRTLVLGSALQTLALALFLPTDGLVPLFVVSALFGLAQGGIVPAYAIIIREHFSARDASVRVGTVIMFTMLGMALGGWMSGKAYDLTGSYTAAFANGIAWNILNFAIAVYLLHKTRLRFFGPGLRLPAGSVPTSSR